MGVHDWTVLKGQENANELNKQLNYKKLLNPIQQKMFEKIIHIGKNFIYTFKLWGSKIQKCSFVWSSVTLTKTLDQTTARDTSAFKILVRESLPRLELLVLYKMRWVRSIPAN